MSAWHVPVNVMADDRRRAVSGSEGQDERANGFGPNSVFGNLSYQQKVGGQSIGA
jgi:hypothetical protein